MRAEYGRFLTGDMPMHHAIRRGAVPTAIRRRFSTLRPIYRTDELISFEYDGKRYDILSGFYTDFSSIPFFIPRPAESDAPGAVHDALCRSMKYFPPLTWRKAAKLYQHALLANGLSRFFAWSCYTGLILWTIPGKRLPSDSNPKEFLIITEIPHVESS
jgi:hypothetical protein